MDTKLLAILEKAVEPYRNAGYTVLSQSERTIALISPPGQFNYWLFILFLFVFWPIAVLYLISFNNRRNRTVCLRITAEGNIEESGYTLDLAERERLRERVIGLIVISIFVALTLIAILLFIVMSQQVM